MKKEKKVISLELAKKIFELAKKKCIKLPESEYYWTNSLDGKNLLENYRLITNDDERSIFGIPAYDIAELGELLPREISYFNLYLYPKKDGWICDYSIIENGKPEQLYSKKNISLANAMGEMYLYYLEYNLL